MAESFRFLVEAGHIQRFARSVGDPNPVYHDEEAAKETEVGGIVAPPTFVQSSAQFNPDYPLRPKFGEAWFGSGKTPSGVPPEKLAGGTGLHAEQHFEYHRPLRAGEVLTVSTKPGESWEKEGRKGGKLKFSSQITEYRDPSGELVVTARSVGVQTEKVVQQEES